MAIDLKQLSARLGLSPTTVSRALGGYADVRDATRQRVVQAAQELGYQPNQAARRLARGRADAVGIVYPVDTDMMGNPLFLEMIAGVSARLDALDIDVMLVAARETTELRTYERLVRGRLVDGLIVAHTRVTDERIAYLQQARFPFVGYGRTASADDFAWFDFDNAAGTAHAVREMASRGHRRIGYVHAPLTMNFAHLRHVGFLRGMAEAGLAVSAPYVVEGGLDRRGGHAAGKALLALALPPTAILIDNNLAGVGAMRALLEAGVAIGQDISVIVYDGVPPDTLLQDEDVASVRQPTAHESGRQMADMLLALIDGQPLAQRHVLRQTSFVSGRSLGPAPSP